MLAVGSRATSWVTASEVRMAVSWGSAAWRQFNGLSAGNCFYHPQPEVGPQITEAEEAGRCCDWSVNLVVAAPLRRTPRKAGWVVLAAQTCCAFHSDNNFRIRNYNLTVTRSSFLAADCTDSTKPMGAVGPMYVGDSEAKQDLKSCAFADGSKHRSF